MFLGLVSFSSAQHLMDDTVWLKMRVSVKGHEIFGQTEPIQPYSDICTIFVRFSPAAEPFNHDWKLWAFDENGGNWEESDSGTLYIQGERDGIIMHWSPNWFTGHAFWQATIHGFMKIKRDGLITKSAKFTTDGCIFASMVGAYGGCKVTGSLVKQEKLPFSYP